MTNEGIVVYGKSKLLWCVIVALFVTIVALLDQGDGKRGEIVQRERITTQFKELQLPLNFQSFHVPAGWHQFKCHLKQELSGRIFIPPGHSVTVDATHADIYFHGDKEPLRIRSGEAIEGGTRPSHSTFKICGEGEAEIFVQPTRSSPVR